MNFVMCTNITKIKWTTRLQFNLSYHQCVHREFELKQRSSVKLHARYAASWQSTDFHNLAHNFSCIPVQFVCTYCYKELRNNHEIARNRLAKYFTDASGSKVCT